LLNAMQQQQQCSTAPTASSTTTTTTTTSSAPLQFNPYEEIKVDSNPCSPTQGINPSFTNSFIQLKFM
jgi:hypothetical protein